MSATTRTSRRWIAAVAAAASLILAGCASSALRYRFQPRLAAETLGFPVAKLESAVPAQ